METNSDLNRKLVALIAGRREIRRLSPVITLSVQMYILTMEQGGGSQAEHISLTELKRQKL